MKREVREVQQEVQILKDNGEIEDFRLGHSAKHRTVNFQFRGAWYSTVFPSTPRTPYANNFVRQQIRRQIRRLETL